MAFLDTLWMALQPIVDLKTGQVAGHEALVRGPAGSTWETPDQIFRHGRRSAQTHQLEETCRHLALTAGQQSLPRDEMLFMNVDLRYGGLLIDPSESELRPERVAIELSEKQDLLHLPHALERLAKWRAAGHKIVLDDYTTGHASLGTLLAVQPDMVKIDRFVVEHLDTDRKRRVAVEAVLNLMQELGITVIAEGVETDGELRVLREIGVEYGQGFMLGRPMAKAAASPISVVVKGNIVPVLSRQSSNEPEATSLDDFHDAMLDCHDKGVYYVDRRRTILRWNQVAEKIAGFTAAEMVGRRCMNRTLDHTDESGNPLCYGSCPLVQAMADGSPRQEIVLLRHKLGHRVRVTVSATPVRDGTGRIIGAVEMFAPVEEAAAPTDRIVETSAKAHGPTRRTTALNRGGTRKRGGRREECSQLRSGGERATSSRDPDRHAGRAGQRCFGIDRDN